MLKIPILEHKQSNADEHFFPASMGMLR